MSFLSRILGLAPKRPQPERVPTDEVVPMHLFDDVYYLRGYTLIWTFKFDDVLDADMLGRSLAELFQSEGWRKLGGRLRKKPDGKIEVHIPSPFTVERPPLHFTKEHFDVRMSEHPDASKLPAAGKEPAIFEGASHHASLALGPGAPRTLDDYLHLDVPLFALHVVTFEDGTLVSINFHHFVSDLAGLRCILDAWQLHLAGKPEAKAQFMSVEDGMRPLYESPPGEKHVIADSRLSSWQMINFGIRFLWDSWWTSYEIRTVCLPKEIMDTLIRNARNDLANSASDGHDAPFITEGDVLLALTMRMAAQTLPHGSTRAVNMLIAIDPRARASSVFRKDAAYVQNAPSAAFKASSAPQAREMALGDLALQMREAIALQSTEEQLKAAAFMRAEEFKKTGNIPMYGDPNGILTTSSNWSKAKLLESIDFSRAVVKRGATSQHPGHPVFYQSCSLERGTWSASVLIIMGRDHEGNMWLSGDYPGSTWSWLMEFLKSQ